MPARSAPDPLRGEAALTAILALLVAWREDADGATRRKTEVVLADAGLSSDEIARLLGKNPAAIRKAIERDRKR